MPAWVVGMSSFLLFFVLLWLTKFLVIVNLRRLFKKTEFSLGHLAIDSSKRALSLVSIAISIILTRLLLKQVKEIPEHADKILLMTTQVFVVLAVIVFVERLTSLSLTRMEANSPVLKTSGSLLKGSIRIVILCIGVLIILGTLGVSITPVLASLGIGSLAVALALQPTLENFFSGIQIIADKPFRVGDYIELDSGEQGFVEKIGWRSTWIKMLPNNVVIMPNSTLAKSKVINYYYPEKQLSVPVEVGVHYDSDLEHVEKVTLEVAREILKSHKWGISDYETFVVFHTFDNSSINFTVMLRAEEYFNRFFIKSEFMKALHRRFNQEGIVIPFPITALNVTQEQVKTFWQQEDAE
ncbi:mechanosensitive ion channel family protein [Glaciecola sp. 1036]|uniref:mechanosensitive ion channel family protein n=1 Tax=Alteromonadaceae TaxID=72275 RepID=UPI003D08CC1C